MESKIFCTSFLSRDVVLLPLKKLFYFFSCFPFLQVVSLSLRTSLAVPASLRLLKAGNSSGLPSLSLLVSPYFMSVNNLFGHFLGSSLQFTGHANWRKWGWASPPFLSALLPHLIEPNCVLIQPYHCLQVPVFLSFVSRELTNSLAQWEVISENVLPHEDTNCLIRDWVREGCLSR